jgi:hypothetical protein
MTDKNKNITDSNLAAGIRGADGYQDGYQMRCLPAIKIERGTEPKDLWQNDIDAEGQNDYSRGGEPAAGDLLTFWGTIKENEEDVVEGALVIVFACYENGDEKVLGYANSGEDGSYLINAPKLSDNGGVKGFIIRAGKAAALPEKEAGADVADNAPARNNWFAMMEAANRYPNRTLKDMARFFVK